MTFKEAQAFNHASSKFVQSKISKRVIEILSADPATYANRNAAYERAFVQACREEKGVR